MIVSDIHFDPVRDLKPVDQFGFIDLRSALANSVVPSSLPDSDSDYNGIDEPRSVLGKPSDVFEAIDMQSALQDVVSESDSDEK